ncbi:hypothetical protein [Aeromonas veronii]|uniref:hypothetical protein n=1 Tax=Aeromonas veronii TaxID=654 RepID=UPI003BA0DB16
MAELLNNPDYLYSFVKKIEDQFPVEKLTFCGERVWNTIRPLLCGAHMWTYNELGGIESQVTRKCLPIYENNKNKNYGKRSSFFMKEMEYSFILSEFKSLNDIDVIFFDAIDCYMENDDGEVISSIFDPFCEYFKENNCINMLPFDNRNKKLTFKRNTVFYRNLSDRYVEHANYSSRVTYLKELMIFLKKNNIPTPFTSNKIESWVRSIYIRGDMFVKIFSEIRPKIVFITSFRSSERMAVVRACKLLNIHVVEVQHGILGPEYYHLKVSSKHEWVPDAFWLWGESSFKKMAADNRDSHISFLIGGKPNIIDHLSNSSHVEQLTSGVKTLLFIEQYTHSNFSSLISSLVDKLVGEKGQWRFKLRLHPKSLHLINTYKNELSHLDIDIEDASKAKLYDVLLSVDLVIAESSTVVYEANALGKKVVVYGENAYHYFKDEIEKRVFIYAEHDADIIDAIDRAMNAKFISSSFFTTRLNDNTSSINKCLSYIRPLS